MAGRSWTRRSSWGFALALFLMMAAVHVLLVAAIAQRRIVKPLLAVLGVATSTASYYMGKYGAYLDWLRRAAASAAQGRTARSAA